MHYSHELSFPGLPGHVNIIYNKGLPVNTLKQLFISFSCVSAREPRAVHSLSLVGIRFCRTNFTSRQCIPAHIYPLLKAAKDSVDSLQLSTDPVATRTLKAAVTKQLNTHKAAKWDAQPDGLQVQFKFKDNVTLESVWNRIISGLPSRQMSFVLRAGSDTLPMPLDLAQWKIQSNPRCPICGS